MPKRVTAKQLRKAFRSSPQEVIKEGKIFLLRGLSEYKRIAVQTAPWRVGKSGGGVPISTGNLREMHRTEIKGLEGRFGVPRRATKYAGFVHGGTRRMEKRPWLDFARQRADKAVERHYNTFMDNILAHIAT